MGICMSYKRPISAADVAVNGQIGRQLTQDKRAERSTVRMLLLGAGECGKSTVLKQLQCVSWDLGLSNAAFR